ncbi:Uncharacterized protein Adt_27348 [Abeliophyllum distichum]|uniref:Uncharacterized protein n=1 Tax=Abeliophyllum distichum TaxID=126358 RepID=A0ABD1RTI4_9LAMI
MAPKRPPTTAEKGKKKATGGTSKRPRVETTDSRHYLSEEHEERFKNFISHWTIWGERRLQLDDFPHSELYNLIDICGWSKIADTPHKIYSQLVHEFYANFNQDIDIQGTEHYGQTWVRGKWFMFTLRIINNYYGITTDDIHLCPLFKIWILPAEPVIKAKGPINRFALENARRHTARAVGAVPDAQDQPPEEHAAAPQPAAPPADITSMLRQILEGQAEHTRLIVATRTEMRAMQQELATLRARMDSFRHAQMNQESRQRNIDIEQRRI